MIWQGCEVSVSPLITGTVAYRTRSSSLRGSGLLLGIRCVVPAAEFVAKLRQNGLLTLTAGENVLRILPPLIVGEREIDEALGVMHKVAAEWPT